MIARAGARLPKLAQRFANFNGSFEALTLIDFVSLMDDQQTTRLLFIDDNLRDQGGHYFELATQLLDGANQLGYAGAIATHKSFATHAPQNWQHDLQTPFNVRRMLRWSLGVDGASTVERDFDGAVLTGDRSSLGQTARQYAAALRDRTRLKHHPKEMVRLWVEGMKELFKNARPTIHDRLVLNTGDDFVMLALVQALRETSVPPLPIHVIFHFSLCDQPTPSRNVQRRWEAWGNQVNRCLQALVPHTVHLHATTPGLAQQIQRVGVDVSAISYPTRIHRSKSKLRKPNGSERMRVVLAGLPRAEKGRGQIRSFLESVASTGFADQRLLVSMQMPDKRWQRMVPASLHNDYQNAKQQPNDQPPSCPLEVMTNNLSTAAYHDWLDSADVGLFLYDPQRYANRCSGVLLEMMIRGVPVIVPNQCWLAEQVELAGGQGSIGWMYDQHSQIPDLLDRFLEEREAVVQRCAQHASLIAERHCGRNALLEMGITDRLHTQSLVA